jgi:hypothetical protein
MFEDDTNDANLGSDDGDAGASVSGPVSLGNSGWQAGDFQNGLGLLGMVPPGGLNSSPSANSSNPFGASQSDTSGAWSDTAMTKAQCLDVCSKLALPTKDFGVAFQRCMNQCQGKNSYPEWEGRVG